MGDSQDEMFSDYSESDYIPSEVEEEDNNDKNDLEKVFHKTDKDSKKSKSQSQTPGQTSKQVLTDTSKKTTTLTETSEQSKQSLTESPTESSTQSSKRTRPRAKVHHCDFKGCDKVYSRTSLLDQHKRSHTGERPFICTTCGDSFFRASHLKIHKFSHLKDSEKPFRCETCGKGCNTTQHLRRHIKTHIASVLCTYEGCDAKFHRKTQLNKHIRINHTHEKQYKCSHEDCTKEFSHKARLKIHMAKCHSNVLQYHCEYETCGRSFENWTQVRAHINKDHLKLKCPKCGKSCVGNNGLAKHLLIHDELKVIKKWKCEICPELFAKKAHLRSHYENEHAFVPANFECNSRPPPLVDSNTTRLGSEVGFDSPSTAISDDLIDTELVRISTPGLSVKKNASSPSSQPTKKRKISHLEPVSTMSMINWLTGNYEENRNIPCPFDGCSDMFTRQYDRDRHIKAAHLAETSISPSLKTDKSLEVKSVEKSISDANQNKLYDEFVDISTDY